MNKLNRLLLILVLPFVLVQCGGEKKAEHSEHDGHDHGSTEQVAEPGHEGHDHGHGEHHDHGEHMESAAASDGAVGETGTEGRVEQPVIKKKQFSMKTSMGEVVLELDYGKAPITCENFENYVKKGHYNGTIFHRVIPDFMIQGGGFTPDMQQKSTDAQIENEATNGLKNDVGTIAMARTSAVHSATSQFFINVNDNDFLNNRGNNPQTFGYCVFGKVVKGMEIVTAIEGVPTASKGQHQNVPVEPVVIESISLLK